MRNNIQIIALLLFAFLASCTENFEELDRPKTTANTIAPDPLFTRALVTGSGLSVAVWQWQHQISGSVYAQHFANIQTGANFTSDNYEPRPWNPVWEWYYSRSGFAPMHYTYRVIELAQELENPIKESIARIWRVYLIQQVTDMYGDIPVSEAFLSVKPAFDKQSDIYYHMLEELENAITGIKEFRDFGFENYGDSDVIYQGNLDNWIAFANSMILRIGLRASNTASFEQPLDGYDRSIRSYIENIDPAETISSHQQTVQILPDATGPTYHVNNPLSFVQGWQEVRLSKTLVDMLEGYDDPRLMVFANENIHGEYAGLPNGQDHSDLSAGYTTYYQPEFSNVGDFFTEDQTPHYVFTYAESSFLKAEAAQKGLISGSAQQYYEEAIAASFQQFGITESQAPEDYLQGNAAFDAANALEQIYTQRWIALYPNGHEAWSLVRRTGVPEMMQPAYTFPGNDEMPRRKMYPESEKQFNAENYQIAVDRMGGDSQYTRMWWDGGN